MEMNNKTIKNAFPLKCPHCGNEEFFYHKIRYSGECWFEVNNQGECDETCYNADMYNDATYKLKSIYYFCEDCHCKVAKIPMDKRY
jgi:hypothetical protein